jgi:hypothetical protein
LSELSQEAGSCPVGFLAKAEPSGESLLEWLRPRIDDAMLRDIATADCGCDLELHLEQLVRLRDGRTVSYASEWHPQEALELIRWSQPDDPHWRPGGTGIRGHLMRAFACAVLLRSSGEPCNWRHDYAIPQTLQFLWESITAIADRDGEERTIALLAWLAQRSPPTWGAVTDSTVCKLAFLLASFTAMRERWTADEFGELARWIVAEEASVRRLMGADGATAWSQLKSLISQAEKWRRCLEKVLAESTKIAAKGAQPLQDFMLELLTAP